MDKQVQSKNDQHLERIQALKAEIEENRLKSAKLYRLIELEEMAIKRLELVELIGQSGAVILRYRDWCQKLATAEGTVLKVLRTNAVVGWGTHGTLKIPIVQLMPKSQASSRRLAMELSL